MVDARTLAAYAARAQDYAALTKAPPPGNLLRFIALMPAGGRVLDLGCGPGQASAAMRDAGLRPDPLDASPEMVALARESHGLAARLGTFDDIEGEAVYDGVWASFSLLHAARADLPRHLAAIGRALRPGGWLHIGMKLGTGAARDGVDRLYTYVSAPELEALIADAGLTVKWRKHGREVGLAGTEDPFVLVQAEKPADG